MKGYKETNHNGIDIVHLHYSADDNKNPSTEQGNKWFTDEVGYWQGGKNSLRWQREMEINPKAGRGERVFPTLDDLGIIIEPFKVDMSQCSLFGGFDWGTKNPTSFHVYASYPMCTYSIWEYYNSGLNVKQVAAYLAEECPYRDSLEWIAADPSIWTENQNTDNGIKSVADMFLTDVETKHQLQLMPAHGRSDQAGIEKFKILFQEKKFKFFDTCFNQIDEFRNLKYPEMKQVSRNPKEKIVDKYNHAWDDAKYFILSHPDTKSLEPKIAKNDKIPLKYYNKIHVMAEQLAESTGEDVQKCFNQLYGRVNLEL